MKTDKDILDELKVYLLEHIEKTDNDIIRLSHDGFLVAVCNYENMIYKKILMMLKK